jgi:hypothetical protein
VVLAVAAAAGRKIRILIRSESGAQQREAEEGQQQDGREAPQAIILAHFESKPEAQRHKPISQNSLRIRSATPEG